MTIERELRRASAEEFEPSDARYADQIRRNFNKRAESRPDYFCIADSTEAVVEAVQRAVSHRLRLVVRSGGHCLETFVSDPTVRVIIDLLQMTGVSYDPGRKAFAIEAGTKLGEVYRKLFVGWGVVLRRDRNSQQHRGDAGSVRSKPRVVVGAHRRWRRKLWRGNALLVSITRRRGCRRNARTRSTQRGPSSSWANTSLRSPRELMPSHASCCDGVLGGVCAQPIPRPIRHWTGGFGSFERETEDQGRAASPTPQRSSNQRHPFVSDARRCPRWRWDQTGDVRRTRERRAPRCDGRCSALRRPRNAYSVAWLDAGDHDADILCLRQLYADVFADSGGVPVPGPLNDGALINHPDADIADPEWNRSGVPWRTIYYPITTLGCNRSRRAGIRSTCFTTPCQSDCHWNLIRRGWNRTNDVAWSRWRCRASKRPAVSRTCTYCCSWLRVARDTRRSRGTAACAARDRSPCQQWSGLYG